MSEACEDRDGRAGGATMLQPVILRLRRGSGVTTRSRDVRALTLWQGWNEVHCENEKYMKKISFYLFVH